MSLYNAASIKGKPTTSTCLWRFYSMKQKQIKKKVILPPQNTGTSPAEIKVLFLSRATSPCLLSAVQLSWLVLSAGCYLGALINLSTVWATWSLSEPVLLEKDPWPPGLHRPCIDLSLVLLSQPHWPILPWALSLSHFLTRSCSLSCSFYFSFCSHSPFCSQCHGRSSCI